MKLHLPPGLAAGAAALALVGASPAAAAPVTVQLRIEGPTRTLFEGPVTTDVRTFHFTGGVEHTCDGSPPAGTSSTPEVTRGAVFTAAEDATPFTAHGTWSDQFASPSFSDIAGEAVGFDAATSRFLVEYKNAQPAQTGACGDPVHTGDRVLFAYGSGSEPLLHLAGPAAVGRGATAEFTVTNEASGAPVAGAAVGGATTGADGRARLRLESSAVLKATKPGAIRSNRLAVTVSGSGAPVPGVPVQPAAPDRTPPGARILGIREKQVFRRGKGPRVLRARVPADPSGLAAVKLRLTRQARHRCWYFSGRFERFRRTRCGRRFFFKVGDQSRVSYLLPHRLRHGRYVLDVVGIDRAGNRDALARGRTRVVFRVR